MSFVRAKKAQAIKAEDLKGPETVSTGSLATTLTETNKILVEIQNQLAIDFANRIAEKKQTLKLSKKQVRKKKLAAKEDFVERGKGLFGNIKDFGKKVLSPVKGIFDKIIDFLTIVGAGIALNAAFEWLSDEKNREKLVRVFNFLRDHWKTLLAIVIGGKILGLLLKLKGLFSLARSLTRRLKNLFGKNGKFKPGGEDFCRGVVACVVSKLPQIILSLLASALFINQLKPKLGIPNKPPVPTPPVPVPVQPVLPDGTLAPGEQTFDAPGDDIFNIPDIFKVFPNIPIPDFADPLSDKYNELLTILSIFGPALGVGAATMIPGLIRTPGMAPPVPSTARPSKQFGPNNPTGTINPERLLNRPQTPANTIKKTPTRSSEVSFNSSKIQNELSKQIRQQYETLKSNGYSPKNATREIERRFGKDVVLEALTKGTMSGFSIGGTIPGKGPTNVDSVPAILAPGEEVIRSSSANMFRPVLKDINNNAGRMFLSFKSGVEQQARNFGLQQEETNRSVSLFKKFGDLVEKQVKKLEKKKLLEELEKPGGFLSILNRMQEGQSEPETQTTLASVNSSSTQPQASPMSNPTSIFAPETESFIKLMGMISEEVANNKPKIPEPKLEPVDKQPVKLEVVPFNPETIQTYNHRKTTSQSSGEGSIETMNVNLPPTVIQTPKQQQQAQPQEQPRESSSSDILIAPMDIDNPFFGRSFSAYGVEL